jgi:choline dehydrogenase-like flavoprotein
VCVVGSGAGGGTAAGVLAAAGLDVVVVEGGEYYDDEDFDGGEYDGYTRLYLNGGGLPSTDQSVGLLAGMCLGGGTTVNYTTSFRTPDDVRSEWASHGVPAFASDEYGRSLDAVCERLGVNQEHNTPSSRERVMQRGVEARTVDGHGVKVHARAVVAACGAVHTPALLRRSGLSNGNIGRHLRLHPATVTWGVFDEEVRPWEGTMQALYSDQHRYLDGGYGVKYETAAIHPSLLVTFSPWRGARDHLGIMDGLSRSVPIGVLLRDRDGGEVKVGRDGQPFVKYALSDYDRRHVRTGMDGAAQILEAAGARKVFSSQSRFVSYEPGRGSREVYMREADACGYGAGRCTFGSFHIMGSARMGGSPAESACNPRGETWEVADLYVCDGSAFPTASGVNPMISIEAIAHMNSSALAARLS